MYTIRIYLGYFCNLIMMQLIIGMIFKIDDPDGDVKVIFESLEPIPIEPIEIIP